MNIFRRFRSSLVPTEEYRAYWQRLKVAAEKSDADYKSIERDLANVVQLWSGLPRWRSLFIARMIIERLKEVGYDG